MCPPKGLGWSGPTPSECRQRSHQGRLQMESALPMPLGGLMPRTFHPNRRFAYVLALVLPLTLLAGAANARADISFRADYENGSCCVSGGWHDVQYEFDRPMTDSFAIVTNPVRQGRYAAKVVAQQGYSPFGWNESTEAASGMSGPGRGHGLLLRLEHHVRLELGLAIWLGGHRPVLHRQLGEVRWPAAHRARHVGLACRRCSR